MKKENLVEQHTLDIFEKGGSKIGFKFRISDKARRFVGRKIAANIDEGKDPQQAKAIAFSQARHEGYKVPKPDENK